MTSNARIIAAGAVALLLDTAAVLFPDSPLAQLVWALVPGLQWPEL